MRPYVHVNCAMSADGKIAGTDRGQVTISSPEDRLRAMDLRRRYDAVLVGIGTVIADDPHLTVKGVSREANPVRLVIDPHGRCPADASVTDGSARTIFITLGPYAKELRNAETLQYDAIDLDEVLSDLWDMGIKSMLVEGGGCTIASFFREGLVDRYSVYVGSTIIGGKDSPTPADGDGWVRDGGAALRLEGIERMGRGALLTYEVD